MIKVEKDNPSLLKYKTSYKDNNFKIIDIRRKSRKPLVDLKLLNLNSDTKISFEKKKIWYHYVILMQSHPKEPLVFL